MGILDNAKEAAKAVQEIHNPEPNPKQVAYRVRLLHRLSFFENAPKQLGGI